MQSKHRSALYVQEYPAHGRMRIKERCSVFLILSPHRSNREGIKTKRSKADYNSFCQNKSQIVSNEKRISIKTRKPIMVVAPLARMDGMDL